MMKKIFIIIFVFLGMSLFSENNINLKLSYFDLKIAYTDQSGDITLQYMTDVSDDEILTIYSYTQKVINQIDLGINFKNIFIIINSKIYKLENNIINNKDIIKNFNIQSK
jgi:hypothetical protein